MKKPPSNLGICKELLTTLNEKMKKWKSENEKTQSDNDPSVSLNEKMKKWKSENEKTPALITIRVSPSLRNAWKWLEFVCSGIGFLRISDQFQKASILNFFSQIAYDLPCTEIPIYRNGRSERLWWWHPSVVRNWCLLQTKDQTKGDYKWFDKK